MPNNALCPAHAPFRRSGLWVALLMTLLFAGCTHLNVGHLDRRPWLAEASQDIRMQFWTFTYQCAPLKDGVGLHGMAYPNTDLFPNWAIWYDQLAFTAYLSDSTGKVVASSQVEFLPRKVDRDHPIPIEFRMTPDTQDQPLYVSFGYRMVLAEYPWQPDSPRQGRIHIAREGALTQ